MHIKYYTDVNIPWLDWLVSFQLILLSDSGDALRRVQEHADYGSESMPFSALYFTLT